ncbi:hypothetical protein B0H16DRAFT_1529037 [Mycena metata]|uniref:F-box domain-containing protein n=1 Tax=Mycena metata TaxID=1033252 RepID=A0AAD7JDH5_9AGAR|nr:hypothetical protein B0H16DRAFT_1529037 [Mycena metata]
MSSPFASKLGTNYCPTDDEVVEIRDLLVEPLTHLKRLEARIADLQKTIDELAEERVAVSTYVDAHRALISPVRRLPLDILQEIFVACLPTDRNCVMSMAEAPVLLGRICSSWRALSLSTPRLWCSLHIVEPMSGNVDLLGRRINSLVFEEKLAQRLETTAKWLSRSTQLPLSISFRSYLDLNQTPPTPESAQRTRLFLQTLIPFAHRWQSIKLSASWDALDSLSHLTDTDVPLLTKLDITQQRGSASGEWPLPALLRASRLSGFAFAGQMDLYALPVRWENMTALSLTSPENENGTITCRRALEILSKCAHLQFCRLQVVDEGPVAALDPDAPYLELGFLHSLSVGSRGVSTTKLARLLARLVVPALRHLELHSHGRSRWGVTEDTDTAVADLLVFFGTAPAFQSLYLHMEILSKKPLVDLVRGLPLSTTKLHFADRVWRRPAVGGGFEVAGDLDDDVMVALTPAASGNPVAGCPALRELRITKSYSLSDRVLSRFITARMAGPRASALRRVDIQFARPMQVDITPDIQSFLADGRLEVVTTYPPNEMELSFSPWRGLPEESGWKVAPMFSIF